jgi:transcriptional regulator with XRE-family HTH domain
MARDIRIGLRVRALRRSRGLTQAELAERAERSNEAISGLERGKYVPSLDTAVAVARALNVPLAELVGEQSTDSPKRARLLGELSAAARALSDADLETAVEQVNALGRRRKR